MHMGFVKGVDIYWVFMSPSAISFLWIEAWKFTFRGTHSPTLSPPGLDKTDPTPPSIRGNIWSCSRKVGYFIPLTTVIGLNRGMWLKKIQWNSHWNFFWIPSSHLLFSHSVMSDSLWPQELRYARHPVLHRFPKLAQTHVLWVGDAIQVSHPLSPSVPVLNLSQHPGSFLMSWLLASGGQSIGASVSVLPMNIQSWLPLGLTGLISLQSKGLSRSSPTPKFKSIFPLNLG